MEYSKRKRLQTVIVAITAAVCQPWVGLAQDDLSTTSETIEVTATRVPEDVEPVPASITVVGREELLARGATDLGSALALVAGVNVAPGGDAGPAGWVPEFWGLKEFDAFLLVVDGVPWGGAFNPALTTLTLTDVDRIEVLRGAAPVMYGATSFVGVIHVIHRSAGAPGRDFRVSGGSYRSGSASATAPLSNGESMRQSIAANVERQGYRDDRTDFERGQVLYRGAFTIGAGSVRLDASGTLLRQSPASPHPRQGTELSPLVPLDANYNPSNAKLDGNRLHLVAGYERPMGNGSWESTLSLTHGRGETTRGFLTDLSDTAPNAHGYEQELDQTDLYFDTHLVRHFGEDLQLVAGLDYLYGSADAESDLFSYYVPLDGSSAPSSEGLPIQAEGRIEDRRGFGGVYAQIEWTPAPRWRVDVGVRANFTTETRESEFGGTDLDEPEEEEEGSDEVSCSRGSGTVGASYLAWGDASAGIWLFADYRNTFKPAAIDFGPESEPEILQPETADSYEAGIKGRHRSGHVIWQASAFLMDFDNLVLPAFVDDFPTLVNAGSQRFQGFDLEGSVLVSSNLWWQGAYSLHDARFRDYTRLFDGEPFELDGHRLELSPRNMFGTALTYAPPRRWTGTIRLDWVDRRYLDKRNRAEAPAYSTWSAGFGYRFERWQLRVDGTNLTDERPPVAESELGDAQYYLLPSRSVVVSWVIQI